MSLFAVSTYFYDWQIDKDLGICITSVVLHSETVLYNKHKGSKVKWELSISSTSTKSFSLVIWALFILSFLFCATDQEHDKDQENEEETTEENREARHTGPAAKVTEADCESQRAKN